MTSPAGRVRDLPPLEIKGMTTTTSQTTTATTRRSEQIPLKKHGKVPPLLVDEMRELMIGSPVPRCINDDEEEMEVPEHSPSSPCPAIKVDACERGPGTQDYLDNEHMLSPVHRRHSEATHIKYYKPSLLPSRSENSVYKPAAEAELLTITTLPKSSSLSPPVSPRHPGEPSGALCSPLSNRRPIRLVPLNHPSRDNKSPVGKSSSP